MSNRNLVYDSLILRTRESPAGDRILTLMTAESGLVDVFVFGGPKSKLRSFASPFASGRAFVYLEPAKDFRKLSDFEVRESFPALREELGRLWAAGLVAELLVKTSGGGGDFPLVLELSRRTLRALDTMNAKRGEQATALFLWRLLGLLGLGPDTAACVSCGRDPAARTAGGDTGPAPAAAYSFEAQGFLCPSCAARAGSRRSGGMSGVAERPGTMSRTADGAIFARQVAAAPRGSLLPIEREALAWLQESERRSFEDAIVADLESPALAELKTLLFGLARRAAESPLASLASGFLPS